MKLFARLTITNFLRLIGNLFTSLFFKSYTI